MANSNRSQKSRRELRKGSVIVLTAFLLVFIFSLVALSVDVGLAYVSRAEMQRAADAAAIAAVSDLLDQHVSNPLAETSYESAEQTAALFASLNTIGNVAPWVPDGDIEIGVLADRANPNGPITSGFGRPNSARVRIKKTEAVNGKTAFFFGPVIGRDGVEQEVQATATYLSAFRGFNALPNGDGLEILPFTLDDETWQNVEAGLTTDDWAWDPETKTISPGSDGVCEANLYPVGYGMPGNRGTVDIGHSGNSTADIKRQILDGISPADLAYHGGSLEFDECGELVLNGDTGISAAVKTQLEIIKGQPRMIPIFVAAAGNGNNANYTTTKFVGIRILEVKLTGPMNKKRVIIQPAAVITPAGIPDDSIAPASQHIYSPVSIVN